ncbi:tetratricopeptide repeat protein [Leptolyngbya ohadii]|uniref:tetratricopeptide repeat protein n=1 Tax=Leptolyngbya ohadii TaxID=1962290 RepID=UPI000B59E651|nr:tetratricopeptide repeat protein [Leptolyngbya ohadii]
MTSSLPSRLRFLHWRTVKPLPRSHPRSAPRFLHRLTWSSVLSLGLWSMGSSTLALLSASAQTVPSSVLGAYTLLDQGLVNQAIARFERILQQMPQSLEARLGLAIAYRRAGRDADAFQAYERVLTIDSTNRLALLSLGILGGYRPEWQERGIATLTSLLQRSPEDQEARTQRALLYIYQGNFDAAVADYEQVLQNSPALEAVLGAAQAYGYQGNLEKSLSLFDRYRQTGRPLQGDPAIAYARVLRLTGNPTAAVQVLETLLRQQPRLTPVAIRMRSELALNYAALERVDRATAVLAPLRDRADSRMILGRTLIAIGKSADREAFLSEGIALFQTVLADANVPVNTQREIADVLSGIPQYQPIALSVYQRLGLAQPNDRALQTRISVLEHETGKLPQADLLVRLNQLLQPLPMDLEEQRTIAQALGQITQPNPVMLPLYENLVRSGISEPMLYFRIAQMYVKQGRYDTARSVLTTYQQSLAAMTRDNLTGDPNAAAELLLAVIDQRQGNLEASSRRYQAILDSKPSDRAILSGALQGLAGIRQQQGDIREALRLYSQVIAMNPQDPAKRLGQASLQYQADLLSRSDAEKLLRDWLTAQPLTNTPLELYSLVAALPANPAYEMLYRALVQADPTQIGVQVRLVEAIAGQNESAAMAYINQLIERDPDNLTNYFLKGQIAQQADDLGLAASAYEEILKREPENLDAMSALGGVRFQQRRYYAAVDLYSAVLTRQPEHTIARGALSSLEGILKRNLPALRQAQQRRQSEEAIPVLNPLPAPVPAAEFQPQGDTPLPWERRS